MARNLGVAALSLFASLFLAQATPARAEHHTIYDLSITNVFDVDRGGEWLLQGVPPDPNGSLSFETDDGIGPQLVRVVSSGTGDTVPPAAIADLRVDQVTQDEVTLRWTASGDDGTTGRAARYDIRFSSVPLDDASWGTAEPVPQPPTPSEAGLTDSVRVSGLTGGSRYYFGLRSIDEMGNRSALSNIVEAVTLEGDAPPDTTAPRRVTDLRVVLAGASNVILTCTAVGEDAGEGGPATRYDLRYSLQTITAWNWEYATRAAEQPQPGERGHIDTLGVSGLDPQTLYYFAVRVADEVENWSEISNLAAGQTQAEGEPPPPYGSDTTPPAPIADMFSIASDTTSVTLRWTASGDDGRLGTAALYDLRYAGRPLTEDTWDDAIPADAEPVPSPSGAMDSLRVGGLEPGLLYYFALKTADEAGNWSGLSNVARDTTGTITAPPHGDQPPPAVVVDLTAASVESTAVLLRWTAPDGGGGVPRPAHVYDLRYSTEPLDGESWHLATRVDDLPRPSRPGEPDSVRVAGLSPSTTYHCALRSADSAGNWSGLSPEVVFMTAAAAPGDDPPPEPEPDVTSPAAITTLTGYMVNAATIHLLWQAVGDDGLIGTAAAYEIRWSEQDITEETWGSLDSIQAGPDPAVVPPPAQSGVWQGCDWTRPVARAAVYVAMKTTDESGNRSALSNVTVIQPAVEQDHTPPSPPPAPAVSWNGDAVAMAWPTGEDSDVAGYQIWRRRSDQQKAVLIAEHVTADHWRDTEAVPGLLYAWSLAARDASGNLSERGPETFLLVPLPSPPSPLIVGTDLLRADPLDVREDCVRLRWSVRAGAGLRGFRVYREHRGTNGPGRQTESTGSMTPPSESAVPCLLSGSPGPEGEARLMTLSPLEGPGPHMWEDRPTPPPGSYLYWVEALGPDSTAEWLEPVPVSVPAWKCGLLSLHPNPCVGPMQLDYVLEQPGEIALTLYDLQGRCMGEARSRPLAAGVGTWAIEDFRSLWGRRLEHGMCLLVARVGEATVARKVLVLSAP